MSYQQVIAARRTAAVLLGLTLLGPAACQSSGVEPFDSVDDDTADDDTSDVAADTCWTVAADLDQVVVIEVDLDSDAWFEEGRYGDVPDMTDLQGFVQLGDTLILPAVGQYNAWVELNLVDGSQREGGVTHRATVATDGETMVAFCSLGRACRYDSFDDILARERSGEFADSLHASRITGTSDRLYAAWHSTDEVDVYDFHSAEFIETVELDTWDQWVQGMAVRGDSLHLLNRDATTAWIARFDLDTGVLADEIVLEDLPYEGMVGGLWCP